MARKGAAKIRPVCFVVMPYGTRRTDLPEPGVPEQVDFDALYANALAPEIEARGYTAVRADQETSPLIVVDMLERLTQADLVLADLTIQNGNVYYEVGVRHATEKHNCVLIAATWAKPLFDLQQIRQGRYPLPAGELSPRAYKAVRAAVGEAIAALGDSPSPVHRVQRGAQTDRAASTFAEQMRKLSAFQSDLRAMALLPTPARRKSRLQSLLARHAARKPGEPMVHGVAIELLHAVRDHLGWQETVSYIRRLPRKLREMPYVREQLCLAQSKSGDHEQAIAALEQLVREHGETSERRGLLGGRFKKLWAAAKGAAAARHLDQAIGQYERGMCLDLNDYYPSCNLPRLYRARGAPGDQEKATAAAHVAVVACERARLRDSSDPWLRPTLLGAAFDAGDVNRARELAQQVRADGAARWRLETTHADLERSADQQADPEKRAALAAIAAELAGLLRKETR